MHPPLIDLLSNSARHMRASEIRELLKLLEAPGMISFAGGLPNPEAFPFENLQLVINHVLAKHGREAFQYGVTEGHTKLREAIAHGMGHVFGAPQSIGNVLVTTGSQQALNLLTQIFVNPGDVVLTENPSYLGALQTFRSYQARIEAVPVDQAGLRTDLLEQTLRRLRAENKPPKFIYTIPNFQNPSGVTLSRERREQLVALAEEYRVLLVEDDAYGLLRFEGEPEPLLKRLDASDRVVYLGSFSKILAPGFRVGWVAGPEEVVNRVAIAKQAQDLCTNTFGQYCVYEAIHHDRLFPHVAEIVKLYRGKRDLMLRQLAEQFPSAAVWSRPQGGMFIWVTLPEGFDAAALLPQAVKHQVAYVDGTPFFPNGGGRNCFRLNFSYASDSQILEGIARLGRFVSEQLSSGSGRA
ncbi:MAG: PLP-dependent aminotransferase family protein [candidate division FCPU426 bacterium]